MSSLFNAVWNNGANAPLAIGAILIFISSRGAAQGLAGGGNAPGRRAIGHWIPIAVAAILATMLKQGDLAISIIFSTSVASLSLVLGSIVVVAPTSEAPANLRRLWPFILPAAMLPL